MRYVLLVLLLAAFVAESDDVAEPAQYWTGPINSAVPATIRGGQVIDARELSDLLQRTRPILIDVSNAPKKPEGMSADSPWLPLPHEAIAGSVWIPGAGMGAIAEEIDALFREHVSQQAHGNLDHPVVIYCHEHCWLSWNAAKRAINYGYRRVYWFPGGIEGWRAAGFRTQIIPAATE